MPEKTTAEEGLEQLAQLEEKILRAVELLRAVRAEKEDLAQANSELRRKLSARDQEARILEDRVSRFEKERDTVKARVQKILDQVDTLTQAAADAG